VLMRVEGRGCVMRFRRCAAWLVLLQVPPV
jgi:hypothetical protein